jgi:hypothetical protein
MEQLKFKDFFHHQKREKILSTGEKIIFFKIKEIKSNNEVTEIHIIFNIEKPDGVIVEKTFIFNLKNPKSKPQIKSEILFAPIGLRVFDSEESRRNAETISYAGFQEIKKQTYAIFKDRLKKIQK